MKTYLITSNPEKLAIAQSFLGIGVEAKDIECPEIQDKDVAKIAAFSAKWAANKLKVPVIKNDCALEIEVLNGFPGPFVAYVERWIKEDGFLRIMKGIDNRNAKYNDATAFCMPGKEPIVFTSTTEGMILKEKQGKYGWGLDKIFAVKGDNKSMATYPDNERINLFNNEHWQKVGNAIKEIFNIKTN
jgi:XTP/dITP diphosphohydrolase